MQLVIKLIRVNNETCNIGKKLVVQCESVSHCYLPVKFLTIKSKKIQVAPVCN